MADIVLPLAAVLAGIYAAWAMAGGSLPPPGDS